MNSIYKLLALLFLLFPIIARANDQDLNLPAPDSAEKFSHALAPQFNDPLIKDIHPHQFLEDSKIKLSLRNYFLDRIEEDPKRENSTWSQGGSIAYQSGKYHDFFSLKAEYFIAHKLKDSDNSKSQTSITGEQENYGILGVANPIIDYSGNRLSLYRQRYNYAYLNDQFSRMTPNTFEGYTFSSSPLDSRHTYQYIFGYVDKIKLQNSSNFISMSEAAGVSNTNYGTILGGLLYNPNENVSLGLGNFHTSDTLNIFYAESQYKSKLTEELSLNISGQFSDQRSVGDDLLTGEYYSTYTWGLRNALSYKSVIFRLAFNTNSNDGDMVSPYGSYPSYTSSIIDDFNQAGETSWQPSLSYNLSNLGLEGVSLSTSYTESNGAISSENNQSRADKREGNLTIDFKPRHGLFKDFWFRIRGARLSEAGEDSSKEIRLILNYNLPEL